MENQPLLNHQIIAPKTSGFALGFALIACRKRIDPLTFGFFLIWSMFSQPNKRLACYFWFLWASDVDTIPKRVASKEGKPKYPIWGTPFGW